MVIILPQGGQLQNYLKLDLGELENHLWAHVSEMKPGKTNTALPSNYRGITLTCILSKVLERIVYDQITIILAGTKYTERVSIRISDRTQLCWSLNCCNWWLLLAQDSKMHTAIVFIDLSKAFDNVQHQLLPLKLQQHGIGGSALAWFWSYLHQRSQNAQWLVIRVLLLCKRCSPGQRPWTVTL